MSLGIVVIGRNEGARLSKCLETVCNIGYPAIYVDSGSTDDSIAVARSFNAEIVELDPKRPFSAARARNEGFERLLSNHSQIEYVQFIDGDCYLLNGWLEAASRALAEDRMRAAVVGHLIERNVRSSRYNKLCAMEWRSTPGDLTDYGYLGGISMMRTDVFRELQGFRVDVIAGEDSELGVRMGLAGYRITKIDVAMATHDANINSFRQWWRRSVRAGHAIGQRYNLNGRSPARDCARERSSTIFWGIALPFIILATAVPTHGLSLSLLLGYAVLGCRVWRNRRRMGDGFADALLYAFFIVIGKSANAIGLLKFSLNRLAGNYRIIEYK